MCRPPERMSTKSAARVCIESHDVSDNAPNNRHRLHLTDFYAFGT